jgi:hypothetical protein
MADQAKASRQVSQQAESVSTSDNDSVELQRITTKSAGDILSLSPRTPASAEYDVDPTTAAELAATVTQAISPHRTVTASGLNLSSDVLDPKSPSFNFRLWAKYLVYQLESTGIRRPRAPAMRSYCTRLLALSSRHPLGSPKFTRDDTTQSGPF